MMPGECTHYDTKDGPRMTLRWGTAATLICKLCGQWRDARHYATPRWREPPIPTDREVDY